MSDIPNLSGKVGLDVTDFDQAWTDFITLVPTPFEITVRDVA